MKIGKQIINEITFVPREDIFDLELTIHVMRYRHKSNRRYYTMYLDIIIKLKAAL